MTAQEKVINGLRLIKEGCKDIKRCTDCPFDAFGCIDLYTKPCFWGEEEEVEDE